MFYLLELSFEIIVTFWVIFQGSEEFYNFLFSLEFVELASIRWIGTTIICLRLRDVHSPCVSGLVDVFTDLHTGYWLE